ncbi:MAG: 30S ribosomal protein S11 [Methanobacteriota archaeon]|nr:MAG: 30S ribosomal protein S11 [Euryarchaeota archaeon]
MSRKCIINIYSSYNNILMTATDQTGAETIAKCSGGQVTKKGSDKGSQFAAIRAAERIAEAIQEKGFSQAIVRYRGQGGNKSPNTGPGAQQAVRSLTVARIEDCTPRPHDGTKRKGGRRGRRV